MRTRWIKSLQLVSPCWICLTVAPRAITPQVDSSLRSLGLEPLAGSEFCYGIRTEENWSIAWRNISACLSDLRLAGSTQVGVVAGDEPPLPQEVVLHHKNAEETDEICDHMWLIEAIERKQLTCTYLPVVDGRGEIFGYEALVRGVREDGASISGGEIFKASRILLLEHLIDKYLHEIAIQGFVEQKLPGFLFINFVPGFIQRPEFYLDGLSQAATRYNLPSKQIVLDCTNSEHPKDIQHLKTIAKYCRTKGYMVALDDIESLHSAKRILKEMSPDFIKLDMRLVQRIHEKDVLDTIYEFVDLVKGSACTLIAEGVETETVRESLLQTGINLFQGYLFLTPGKRTPAKSATPSIKKAAK